MSKDMGCKPTKVAQSVAELYLFLQWFVLTCILNITYITVVKMVEYLSWTKEGKGWNGWFQNTLMCILVPWYLAASVFWVKLPDNISTQVWGKWVNNLSVNFISWMRINDSLCIHVNNSSEFRTMSQLIIKAVLVLLFCIIENFKCQKHKWCIVICMNEP